MLPEMDLHNTKGSAFVFIFSIAAAALASCMSTLKAAVDEVIDVRCVFSNNTIYLPVMINGQGGFFMTLDTGTNPSAIDLAKAKSLGLPMSAETSEAKGLGNGAVTTQRTKVAKLNVSGIEATQVEFEALDLSAMQAAADKPIIGILGYSFLRGRIIDIDYPHHRLRLFSKSPPPPSGTLLPLELDHGVPVIEIKLAGKKTHALIDTGGSYKLLVTPSEAKKLGLEKELAAAKPIGGSGYSGEQQLRLGTVPRLAVGHFRSDRIETAFAPFGKESPLTLAVAGLGIFYLQDFALTLDYRARTLTLRK